MVGLGRMGANMVRRLMLAGHEGVVSEASASAVDELAGEGAVGAKTIDQLMAKLEPPRAIWTMVPAAFTERTGQKPAAPAQPVDVVIDGGNSYYHDDIRRAKMMNEHGMHYVDVGTSGGVFGLE